jgi:hypothetical protein
MTVRLTEISNLIPICPKFPKFALFEASESRRAFMGFYLYFIAKKTTLAIHSHSLLFIELYDYRPL